MNNYEPVIGLETHVELMTKSKMFCQCDADYFGKKPNSHVCPVCLGMPGALPVPNKQAIEWTILIGKALHCHINTESKFDRKHYSYPDLPKGYQISQYDEPIAVNGFVEIEGKRFGIRRVHLEEDTGKLIHQGTDTLVDFNRSGVPLVEIVTEPDFSSSDEAKKFGEVLQATVRALGVTDADMEKGSMRLEPNISVRKEGETELPKYKVEVKNINSFSFLKKAIDSEIPRHTEMLEKGETPPQETRGYNEAKGLTVSQRTKEEAHDYRYFPEPDIPPLRFTSEYIESLISKMPELPLERAERYIEKHGVKPSDATFLSMNSKAAAIYEEIVLALAKDTKIQSPYQGVANLIVNKRIPYETESTERLIEQAVEALTAKETDMAQLETAIETVMKNNEKVVQDFKSGKQNAIMFLVGQVMKEMNGKADANKVREELSKRMK